MSSFQSRSKNSQTCWGYTFELSDLHLSYEQVECLKFSYDKLGEQALQELDEVSLRPLPKESINLESPANEKLTASLKPQAKRDLYALLREHATSNTVLGALWEEVNAVPAWVDWQQIERGQEVFYRYGGPILTGLAFQSLL